MAKFSPQFLDRVRLANPIEAVVGERVQLKKSGRNMFGLCPFHNEKTPSFSVQPDRGFYHCFGCHKGGNVFQFVMEHDGVSFAEAVETLALRAGIPLETSGGADAIEYAAQRREARQRLYNLCQLAQQFYEQTLYAEETGRAARAYLERRYVLDAAQRAFRLGYAPDSWDALTCAARERGYRDDELISAGLALRSEDNKSLYDRFRNRLMFPIWDLQGNVIAFGGRIIGEGEPKYMNSPETPIYSKSRILYPINLTKRAIQQKGYAVLCEGYMDVLMLAQHRFTYAVASCGTALTDEQAHLLKRFTNKVIVAYDGDMAGQDATQRSIGVLVEQGIDVFIASLAGGEDPDALLRSAGAEAMQTLLSEAQPFFPFLLQRLTTRVDTRTPHGQRAMCDQVFPLLARFESVLLREGYLDELARYLHLDRERLAREFEQYQKEQAPRERERQSRSATISERPSAVESQIMALVLRDEHALAYARTHLDAQFLRHPQVRALVEAAYAMHAEWRGLELFLTQCSEDQVALITGVLSRVPEAGEAWRAALDDCIRSVHNNGYDLLIATLQKELAATSDPERTRTLLQQIHQYQQQRQPAVKRLQNNPSP